MTRHIKRSLILVVITLVYFASAYQHDAVLPQSINALTLRKGQYTTARRGSPIPQLNCVGGAARNDYSAYPDVVQCVNKGLDDRGEVQWKCEADMDSKYRFGRVEVNCEGYNSPSDPYVLRGSCALEYELEYTSQGNARPRPSSNYQQQQYQQQQQQHSYSQYDQYRVQPESGGRSWTGVLVILLTIGGVFMAIVNCVKGGSGDRPRRPTRSSRYTNSYTSAENGAAPSAGGYGDFYPSAPSYESFTQSEQPSTNSGAGFWTGAAAGAAAGYAASQIFRSNTEPRTSYGDYHGHGYGSDSHRYSNDSHSYRANTTTTTEPEATEATTTRTATGYATTKRR